MAQQPRVFDINAADPPAPPPAEVVVYSVVFRGCTPGDVGVMYDIRSNHTFEDLVNDYASRLDLQPHRITIWKDGESILLESFAEDVGVQTGDVFFVVGRPSVINTNTRIKRFYIKNTGNRRKFKHLVHSKLDTPLCRLYHIWAKEVKADPTNLMFMHEDVVLTTVDTVRDAGIQNGDKIVAIPYYD